MSGGDGVNGDGLTPAEAIPPDELPDDGMFYAGAITIVCACGEAIIAQLMNNELAEGKEDEGEIQEFDVECKKCTSRLQRPVKIPVTILVGRQVAEFVEDDDAIGVEDVVDDGANGPGGGLPPP